MEMIGEESDRKNSSDNELLLCRGHLEILPESLWAQEDTCKTELKLHHHYLASLGLHVNTSTSRLAGSGRSANKSQQYCTVLYSCVQQCKVVYSCVRSYTK